MSSTPLTLPTLDDALTLAAQRRAQGERSIGYVGYDIPVELILAASAHPIRLCEHLGTTTGRADVYVEATFSTTTRQVAQRWFAGELDGLDAVVFSRSDDSAQRLYYYLCELQRHGRCRGPRPLLFDIARIDRSSSRAHTVTSTQRLAAELGTESTQLRAAITRVAQRTQLLAELAAARRARSISGAKTYAALRAAERSWDSETDAALSDLTALPELAAHRRLALIGSELHHELIHSAVESSGAVICEEITERLALEPAHALDESNPIAALGAHYHRLACDARALLAQPQRIVERVHAAKSNGVVLWLSAADSALAWEAPRIVAALRAANIPCVSLTLQPDGGDPGALAQVAQFARSLEAP